MKILIKLIISMFFVSFSFLLGCDQKGAYTSRLELDHGVLYEGQIKNGKANGNGKMTLPNGGVIKGEFKNNSMVDGVLYSMSIETELGKYDGEWMNNAFEGKGVMRNAKGTYNGDWKNGMMDGDGVFTTPSGLATEVHCKKNICH